MFVLGWYIAASTVCPVVDKPLATNLVVQMHLLLGLDNILMLTTLMVCHSSMETHKNKSGLLGHTQGDRATFFLANVYLITTLPHYLIST